MYVTFIGLPPSPPGTNKQSVNPADKQITSPTENEVTLQWYQPTLEETDPSRPDAMGADSRVLLLYALNRVMSGSSSMSTKLIWVPLSQLNDLHDRYLTVDLTYIFMHVNVYMICHFLF